MILNNIEDIVLDNRGLDENKTNFCSTMIYKLTDYKLSKVCSDKEELCCKNNSECMKEINDKEYSKLVNTY